VGYNLGFAVNIHKPQGNTQMASGKPKKKNPRLASGRKRARQDVKLNAANTSLRSKYRTAVKNVEKGRCHWRQGQSHRTVWQDASCRRRDR